VYYQRFPLVHPESLEKKMKSLTICNVATAAATSAAISGTKRKTLPRSKFTRNALMRRIQERELEAEVEDALYDLHNEGQFFDDDGFEDDDSGWDMLDWRDDWRWDSKYGCYSSDVPYDSREGYYDYEDRRDSDDYDDYGDYCRDFDDYYGFDDGYDCLDYLDFGFGYSRRSNRLRFADQWPPESLPSDNVSLGDMLVDAMHERYLQLGDFVDGYEIDEMEVPQEYFEEPDLPAAVYDRPRFSTERFVRRPGRKVRFKKDREQRGGNRRGRCDYVTSIYKVTEDGHYENRRFHPDGSNKIQSTNRHAHQERDCTLRGLLDRQNRMDLLEMVQEYYEDCGTVEQPVGRKCHEERGTVEQPVGRKCHEDRGTVEQPVGRKHHEDCGTVGPVAQKSKECKPRGAFSKRNPMRGARFVQAVTSRSAADVADLTAQIRSALLGEKV
jgi:hypothetical protein